MVGDMIRSSWRHEVLGKIQATSMRVVYRVEADTTSPNRLAGLSIRESGGILPVAFTDGASVMGC